MTSAERALALLFVLGMVPDCGGNVGAGGSPGAEAEAGPEASCAAGAPGCPALDGGGADATAPCAPLAGAVGPCDPVAACGCPNGEACDLKSGLIAPATTMCRPVGGAGPYSYCKGTEDCGPGFRCEWSACRRFCAADSDCDGVDPFRRCVHYKYSMPPDYSSSEEGPYGYCVVLCDPAEPTNATGDFIPCAQGFQCHPVPPEVGQTACANWSDEPRRGSGEPCVYKDECEPGLFCASAALDGGADAGTGPKVCRRWCHVGENQCGGETCYPAGLYAGTIELGFCPP